MLSSDDAPMLDDEPSPRTPGRRRSHVRGAPLSSAGLVALTFFSVTGGPFGQELIVKAGGPFYALLAYALMTQQTCTLRPRAPLAMYDGYPAVLVHGQPI